MTNYSSIIKTLVGSFENVRVKCTYYITFAPTFIITIVFVEELEELFKELFASCCNLPVCVAYCVEDEG